MALTHISDDDLEELGLLVDRCSNFTAGSVLPLPDKVHKEALSAGIQDIGDSLKAWLVKRGFDPWST